MPITRDFVAFVVERQGKLFDTVFFRSDNNADQVRHALIHRDGYPSDIIVRRESGKARV